MTAEVVPLEPRKGIALAEAIDKTVLKHYGQTTRHRQAFFQGEVLKRRDPGRQLHDIDRRWLIKYRDECLASGNAISTVNIKLSFVSVMLKEHELDLDEVGYSMPKFPWAKRAGSKVTELKWWLDPDMEARMVKWLVGNVQQHVADYILFITHTGLRVEEALRLQRKHFNLVANEVHVPGTKTAGAHRTLPLWTAAAKIAKDRLEGAPDDAFLFDFLGCAGGLRGDVARVVLRNYSYLRETWNRLRDICGLHRVKTATVKALRRSFAKRANDAGMPTATLQQYLGHELIQTTIEYLKLVGDNTNVMRQWVR